MKEPAPSIDAPPNPRIRDVLAVALGMSQTAILIELIAAYSAPDWTGARYDQWFFVALFLSVSTTLGTLAGYFAAASVRRLQASSAWQSRAGIICVALTQVLYWAVVQDGWPWSASRRGAEIFGSLGLVAAVLLLRSRSGPNAVRRSGFLLVGIGLSACTAVLWCGDFAYLDPGLRANLAGKVPWIWALVLLGLAAVSGRSRRAKYAAAGLVLALPELWITTSHTLRWAQPTHPGPHVVLISLDTFRPDLCSVFGGPVPTPNLESVARNAAVFSRAYSIAPWTLPSFVGLFASAYSPDLPTSSSAEMEFYVASRFPVQPDKPTLAQQLKQAGYQTCAISTNPWLNRQALGILRGFDNGAILYSGMESETNGPMGLMPNLQATVRRLAPARFPEFPRDASPPAIRFANEFLARYRSKPVFLWIHLMDTHSPYNPPERYRTGTGPWPFFAADIPKFAIPPKSDAHFVYLNKPEEDYAKMLYRGTIQYADENIGRLIKIATDYGLLPGGYLALVSDHGEELWEHGKSYHGQSMYEEQLRALFMVSGPGIPPARSDATISLIHLAPTLSALAGAPASAVWTGRDISERLFGNEEFATESVLSNSTFFNAPENQASLVRGAFKLIYFQESDRYELFDLAADPRELAPLSQPWPDIGHQLKTELHEQFAQRVPRVDEDVELTEYDAAITKSLEALGYL